jgi:glutathione S-transferase
MEDPMKIYNDATSPFGRKTVVAAIERGIAVEEVFLDLAKAEFLDQWNPLRQIPTLVTAAGVALYDSDVIVQFLDRAHQREPLIPAAEAPAILTRMSLANGLMEATLMRVVETRQPDPRAAVIAKLEGRIARALAAIERDLAHLAKGGAAIRGDQLTTAVALGYVDFRFVETWRETHKALGAWYGEMSARRSLALTVPTRKDPVPAAEIARG